MSTTSIENFLIILLFQISPDTFGKVAAAKCLNLTMDKLKIEQTIKRFASKKQSAIKLLHLKVKKIDTV